MYLMVVRSLQVVNFYQLVQAPLKIQKYEMMSRERKTNRKFSRGGSSSDKRTRKSQVESLHGSATKSMRLGPTMTQGSYRGTSTG